MYLGCKVEVCPLWLEGLGFGSVNELQVFQLNHMQVYHAPVSSALFLPSQVTCNYSVNLSLFFQLLTERMSVETYKERHSEPESYFRIENSGMMH